MKRSFTGKLIGDRQFYRMVLAVAIPIMIQNGITNFVSLLDNIMVGQIGTEQMSGVAIVNQLIFVFNICIFGGISGAGIFGAQFFGCGDHRGVRDAFRFKLIICAIMTLFALLLFGWKGDMLIGLYLHSSNNSGNIAGNAIADNSIVLTMDYARQYMKIMMIGMIPFAIEQAYSSTLRETGETILPMKAGICAVLVNLILNYILIFGKFGFPVLGVAGAAIATVIARFVEMTIIIVWTHIHAGQNRFIAGAFQNFSVPASLVKKILTKGTPLMLNEIFWATAQAVLMQCYAVRGLSVIAAFNITSTISNVFNIVFIAMGSAVAIIVGQLLGAGKMEQAKDTTWKLITFSVASCIIMGLFMSVFAPFFPKIYNTTSDVHTLATHLIWVASAAMPLHAFMHATYFTLRSGGKTVITFIFDSIYAWCVSIPVAFLLSRFTGIPIVSVYIICQMTEIFKCILGFYLLKKGIWLQNIIAKSENV